MRISRALLSLGICAAAACDSGDSSDAHSHDLYATAREAESRAPGKGAGASLRSDAGGPVAPLLCPKGGDTGPIQVLFACDGITVITCKDLSNVVLELADGSRQRFEGLNGQQNGFAAPAGQAIVGVWVKAGNNASGDGPGYGERFDAPSATCSDAGLPPPSTPTEPPATPTEPPVVLDPPGGGGGVPTEPPAPPASEPVVD